MKGKVVCVGRRCLFSATLVSLSPHSESGVPASAAPLKSSQCLFMSCTPVFWGLHFCSFLFLNSPSRRPQRNLALPHTQMQLKPKFPCSKHRYNLFCPSTVQNAANIWSTAASFDRFRRPLAPMVGLIRPLEDIVLRPVKIVTRKEPRETIRELIDALKSITAKVGHFGLNEPVRLHGCDASRIAGLFYMHH